MTSDPTAICIAAVATAVFLIAFWRVVVCALVIIGIAVFVAGLILVAAVLQGMSI